LDKADLVFTISRKTRDDILKVFPGATYASKLKAVPLAGSVPSFSPGSEAIAPETITFYYPSSFGIYKDHLTLIEAAIELARKGLKFKVILIGEATDSLVSGNVRLSQQFKTREYRDYLEDCNRVYRENREIFEGYFAGLGYRDYETLEANYRTCSCVVFPSRYEGFGLAIAEGIVRGIPVIASDLEVFKEQVELYRCGDRVRFFPMGNAVALAGLLEDFIRNPLPRLSPEGIPARIALRTWDDVAGEYFTFLQDSGR
jgi:glycosyltransferase involved in cell wall biosynthesis